MKESSSFSSVFSTALTSTNPASVSEAYESILSLIVNNTKQLEQQSQTQISKLLTHFLNTKLLQPDSNFIRFLQKLTTLAYSSKSKLRHSIYQIIPSLMVLLQRSLSTEQQEESTNLKGIDSVILVIYNNQCHLGKKYNQSLQLKMEDYLKQLLKTFETVQTPHIDYRQLDKLDFSNKSLVKTFLLCLYFYGISNRSQKSIIQFFRLIYIYCGGQSSKDPFELYLLNKSNDKTLFINRVSEQQMQWILLILYYIYINYKHLKFEVISAVGIIRKKSANQSKFRIYQIAQSILHLFENQYEDVF